MVQQLVNAIVLCLAAHMVGDYFLQSDWMAQEKTKYLSVATIHALTYSVPFIPVVIWLHAPNPGLAWLVIFVTHAIIDRYRLARHIVWFKNQFAPWVFRPTHTATGHGADRPEYLSVWLCILVDNILHMAINVAAAVLL